MKRRQLLALLIFATVLAVAILIRLGT